MDVLPFDGSVLVKEAVQIGGPRKFGASHRKSCDNPPELWEQGRHFDSHCERPVGLTSFPGLGRVQSLRTAGGQGRTDVRAEPM